MNIVRLLNVVQEGEAILILVWWGCTIFTS
jgi:hypothetical protein